IENSPPGIQTIPNGASRGAGAVFTTVGSNPCCNAAGAEPTLLVCNSDQTKTAMINGVIVRRQSQKLSRFVDFRLDFCGFDFICTCSRRGGVASTSAFANFQSLNRSGPTAVPSFPAAS